MKTIQLVICFGIVFSNSIRAQEDPKIFELRPFKAEERVPKDFIDRLEIDHPEKPKEYWEERIEKIKVGMTRNEVLDTLGPYAFPSSTVLTGGANCRTYHLDKRWSWSVCYDNSGRSNGKDLMKDRLLTKSDLSKMGWQIAVHDGYMGTKHSNKAVDTTAANARLFDDENEKSTNPDLESMTETAVVSP